MIERNEPQKKYAWLWILSFLFVLGSILWHFESTFLIKTVILIKKIELSIIAQFTNNDLIEKGLHGLQYTYDNPEQFTYLFASAINSFIGRYLIFPIAILLVILSIFLFKKIPNSLGTKNIFWKNNFIIVKILMIVGISMGLCLFMGTLILIPAFAEIIGLTAIVVFVFAHRSLERAKSSTS